jgi:hypothetical protein
MEQHVELPQGAPQWKELRDFLAERGFPAKLRMIDGQLAFPDEEPPTEWKELRIGTDQGMVTVRHDGNRLTFVTWGNADPLLLQAWNGLVWAYAHLGKGGILTESGPQTPEVYQREHDLPAALRPSS